jgi:hypothetical protein
MITQQQAERLVYEHLNRPGARGMPEMIIVRVAEHELGWLIFYDSRPHPETQDSRYAMPGTAPFLVSREDGKMFPVGSAAPFEERVREAEQKLRAHLRSQSSR